MKAGCFALIALLLSSPVAHADRVRIEFSGTLGFLRVGISDEEQALWAQIDQALDLGGPFSASLTFDEDAAPTSTALYQSFYSFPASSWDLRATFGEYEVLGSGPVEIATFDTSGEPGVFTTGDQVWAYGGLIAVSDAGASVHLNKFSLRLSGFFTGEPLRGLGLADIPWDSGNFPQKVISWEFGGSPNPAAYPGDGVQVRGIIDSMRRVPVPETASAMLLAFALGALGLRRIQS